MPKRAGDVRCYGPSRHRMIEVVKDKLYVCECSASGSLTNLKGAVEEARRLILRAGGYEVARRNQTTTVQDAKRARKLEKVRRRRGYDSAGSQTPEPPSTPEWWRD